MDFSARLDSAPTRVSRLALRAGIRHLVARARQVKRDYIMLDVAYYRLSRPAARQGHEQIAETVAQPWPRCGGDRIDAAEVWAFAGFDDAQVIEWLEAGVPRAAAAVRLDRAGVTARQVGRQFEIGVTLGLAYTRGDVSLELVLARRRR